MKRLVISACLCIGLTTIANAVKEGTVFELTRGSNTITLSAMPEGWLQLKAGSLTMNCKSLKFSQGSGLNSIRLASDLCLKSEMQEKEILEALCAAFKVTNIKVTRPQIADQNVQAADSKKRANVSSNEGVPPSKKSK